MRLRPFVLCFYRTAFTVQKSGLKSSVFRPKPFPQISPKNYRHNAVSNHFSSRFSTSLTNGPRSLSRAKVHTLGFAQRIAHSGPHAETGAFGMGALLLPSERFARFGNPAWPGVRTAYFGDFGSRSRVLPKNAESLRDSDALMRVAVPRRRGPAGPRDLFLLLSKLWLYALCLGLSACAKEGVVSLPSARFACC